MGEIPHQTSPVPDTPESKVSHADISQWVGEHGEYLFLYTMSRVRNSAAAQDLVQETFMAAFRSRHQFLVQSSPRNWLMAILKNKIYDHFRKLSREISFSDLEFLKDELADHFVTGDHLHDHWTQDGGPKHWTSTESILDQNEFWEIFQMCCRKLPIKIATAFVLREVDGLESAEICNMLNVSHSNLWVMLHRARLALRLCLEVHWHQSGQSNGT
ncbi:MAG: sigma-70 family RNA polymerase sigma factor [Verrucomicrobia bacterium]|nr:sigma-70 family RNA polymerase sigma factor [Verrucomicrobiota bacterium]